MTSLRPQHISTGIVGLALLVLTLAAPSPASAADPLRACFNSRYVVNGRTVNAYIELHGNGAGSYTLENGARGSLRVRFTPDFSGGQSPGYYTGSWSLYGQNGTFRWNTYANGNAFVGTWYDAYGNQGGPWNGQL